MAELGLKLFSPVISRRRMNLRKKNWWWWIIIRKPLFENTPLPLGRTVIHFFFRTLIIPDFILKILYSRYWSLFICSKIIEEKMKSLSPFLGPKKAFLAISSMMLRRKILKSLWKKPPYFYILKISWEKVRGEKSTLGALERQGGKIAWHGQGITSISF